MSVDMPETECTVKGGLAWVLRLSQISGMAPVKLVSCGEGLIVSYSPMRNNLGMLFYSTYTLLIVVGLIWDLTLKFTFSAEYLLIETAVVVSTIINTLLLTAVTFTGSAYVKKLIKFINGIKKRRIIDIEDPKIRKMEKRRISILIFYLCFIVILLLSSIIPLSLSNKIEFGVIIKVVSFTVGCSAILLQVLRFAFDSLIILLAFHSVNLNIHQLLTDVKYNYKIGRTIPWAHEKVRNLADTYTFLCDELRTLNNNRGGELILMLTLLWMYLVSTTYTLVMRIRREMSHSFENVIIGGEAFANVRQVAWCLVHLINILLLIEPCHRTYAEMQMTQYLVTQIMNSLPRSAIASRLDNELDMFFHLVITEKPSYAPYQLFTLNRRFLVKIIGCGMSYLIIVLQF